jgi:glutamate-1-semialdehyde 2,1-aminomutase
MKALDQGFYCNYESESHARVAQHICDTVPSGELVRFCGSGSEATAAALRVSRAVIARSRILKFEGHFNGMHDYVFFNMDATLGEQLPNGEISPVPKARACPITSIHWLRPPVQRCRDLQKGHAAPQG